MAKLQELTDRFPAYDKDQDGQINQQQFADLMTELGLPYQYPGSVNKMFRKLNYNSTDPQKNTINLQQTIEYYSSFETPSKHDIWRTKYSILQTAHKIKTGLQEANGNSAAPAAPGAESSFQKYQDTPQEAKINILIGQPKPNYQSEIEIEVQKTQKTSKVKPFIKLVLTSSTAERAKQIEKVFKENFTIFLNLLAQDISEWTEEMKNFHINSMVQGTTTTFFITTVNEELVSLIQLFSEQFQMAFSAHLECKIHLKFEFQYDFEHFLTKPQSNFYDIFVKQARLSLSARTLRLMREIKNYLKADYNNLGDDMIDRAIPLSLIHLEEFGADLEFDSFGNEQDYELQSKQQISQILLSTAGFLEKLTQGGMTVKNLLQLLDGSIYIEANVGQWRVKSYMRLKNINKLFLNSMEKKHQEQLEESSFHPTGTNPFEQQLPITMSSTNEKEGSLGANQNGQAAYQKDPKDSNSYSSDSD